MYSIYILRDPRTNEIKYVGQTNDPKSRLQAHIRAGTLNDYNRWIIDLVESGHKPEMTILEEKIESPVDASKIEQAYIDELSQKYDLVNSAHNYGECDSQLLYNLIEDKEYLSARNVANSLRIANSTAIHYMRKIAENDDDLELSGGNKKGHDDRYILHKKGWNGFGKPKGFSIKWLDFEKAIEGLNILTPQEICKRTGLSSPTIYKYMDYLKEHDERWRLPTEDDCEIVAGINGYGRGGVRILIRRNALEESIKIY